MIKGIYSSEASMRPKMARLEVIANNLANINSTGYKRDRVFVQVLKDSVNTSADGRTDTDGVEIQRYVDQTEGSLRQTNNPFDLAIQGRGFFVVETPNGVRYTRNGNFSLQPDGELTTPEGYAVLGRGGSIHIPQLDRFEGKNVRITEGGEILIGRESIASVRVVDVQNPSALQKDHQSFFLPSETERAIDVPPDQTKVRQGFLEESNVDSIEEMIAMIDISRSFEMDQRMIKAQDATLDKSLDIGRV